MIKREICVYDKALEIIDRIKSIASGFDFSEYEAKAKLKFNDEQKYLVIKNLMSLYFEHRAVLDYIQSSNELHQYYEYLPSLEELQDFKNTIGNEKNEETKLGVNNLGITRILSNGRKNKLSTAISTWLKNLGVESSGFAEKGLTPGEKGLLEEGSGTISLTEEQNEESKIIAKQKGYNPSDFFIAQMRNIDNLKNQDGSLNGIMVFFTDNKEWIEDNTKNNPMKYAMEQGVPVLVNPSPELIRATIYNLNQNNNNINTIYIESDPAAYKSNNTVLLRNLNKYGPVMFDALFRPYSNKDSLSPKDRSELYIDFQLNESKRHQNLAQVFNPIDRMEITKVMSNEFSKYLTQALDQAIDILEKRRFEERDFDVMQQEEKLLRKLKDKEHGRAEFLRHYGAYPIFKKLHNQWQGWMNLPDRNKDANTDKFRTIRKLNKFRNLSDEKIQEIVDSRKQIFSLVLQRDDTNGIDNFAALFEEAALFIARKEKLKVDMNPNAIRETDNLDVTYDEDDYGVLQVEDINSMATKEELPKDGWMINFRETSAFDSLSKIVRNIIDRVPLLDKDGRQRYYKGFEQYLDSNYVHALLIDKLHNIYDDEDVIPTLQAQTKQYPWLRAIIALIDADNMKQKPTETQEQFIERKKNAMLAFSAFTHDMNKYFTPFWIQKKIVGKTGNFTYQTIAINRPEGTNYLFDSWRNSYESGELLVNPSSQIRSVYTDEAAISRSNAEWNLDKKKNNENPYSLTKLKNLYQTAHSNGDIKSEQKYIDLLIQHMRSVGINTNTDILKSSLASYKNVIETFTQLGIIYEGISNAESVEDIDLLNNFGGAYQKIAELINAFDENAVESSARQGKKQYYSHTVPSYLGNFMKKILNLLPNKKIPKEWIDEYENMSDDFKKFFSKPDDYYHYFLFYEFGRFDWFFHISYQKDKNDPNKLIAVEGKWLNDWIKDLYNGEENDRFKYVNEIKHKVMISYDGKEYSDWDPLSHAIILWNEYNSEKFNLKDQLYSYYHITTLSDANSAEFIRFKRYVNDFVKKQGGQGYYTYQELIKEKMHDLVIQEYNRIQLVKKRKEAFESNDPDKRLDKNLKIQYFDDYVKSIDDKEGSRGLQFNFLPQLNNYMVVEKIDGNRTIQTKFIDKLEQLINNEASKEDIQTLIYQALDDIMEIGFEDAMDEWQDIKLFELDHMHRSKYLGMNDSDISSNIDQAIGLINGNNIILNQRGLSAVSEFNRLIKDQKNYELKEQYRSFIYKDKTLNQLKDSFYEATHKDGQLIIDENVYNKINNLLNKKDNIREAMREYYWNTTFAESQIIEMFTTDLAFYKNPEDFVKRIKEIHAPNSNLNLHAKYYSTVKPERGIEEVGRLCENCVYINDENIPSTTLRELEEALDNRVQKGLLSKLDKDFIVSNYKNITTTDGQGIRTFSSYRRIHIMAGDWSDEQERAYWNIKEGKWDMNDFMVAYQTQKPYMFTQNAVDSGFVETPLVKSAIQHKNSEFMLAAMFDIMSNELGKYSKLRAINRFMEENDIDVIQFASCVKVGLQGAIDFDDNVIKKNHLETEDDMVNYLTIQCFGDSFRVEKFLYGIDNPNPTVVHKISYADWGIQLATPEHLIDHVQLVGTQIRKLVRQDMDDNALIEWNGKKLSKKQWLYLFDAINTENILRAFQELNPKFDKIEEIQKLLIEEMKGNPRYTLDDQESIRIEGDQLVLPLCDPSKANKIEALINSILRKRVTELKINGGSAIQVTAYGTTDDLQIRWKDANGNFIFNEKEFNGKDKIQKSQKLLFDKVKKQFGNNYEAYRNSVKATSIAYVECYMPAVSEAMLRKSFPGLDYKNMKIENIPEEMRKVIGYRIPTENKYSMLPLYIKGFMPQQNGSTIMLPNDWVKQSGSDFDVRLY